MQRRFVSVTSRFGWVLTRREREKRRELNRSSPPGRHFITKPKDFTWGEEEEDPLAEDQGKEGIENQNRRWKAW